MVGECRAAGIPGEKPHVTLQRFIEREGESAPEGNTVQEVWDAFCARSWERQIGLYGAETSGIKAAAVILLRAEQA